MLNPLSQVKQTIVVKDVTQEIAKIYLYIYIGFYITIENY